MGSVVRGLVALVGIVFLGTHAWAQGALPSPKAGLAQGLAKSGGGKAKSALADIGVDWCRTHGKFLERYPDLPKDASCFVGTCDNPVNRDADIPDINTPIKTINLMFHVFRNADGTDPAATEEEVAVQVDQLNAAFAPSKFQFEYEMQFVNDPQFRYFLDEDESAMKNAYADSPDEKLNVYVVTVLGGYLGVGTFPWDSVALGDLGGIIMHNGAFDAGELTLVHEVGHCVGLWHTHHGVSEVTPCTACYERANGVDADRSGDFCSDTAPTPVNFDCEDPGTTDACSSTAWGDTDTQNYMGYAPDDCYTEFSAQQMGRMHCWTEAVLDAWVSVPGDGRLKLDRTVYNCSGTVTISLIDDDLAGNGTASVVLSSTSGDSETVVLTEDSGLPGKFAGALDTESGAIVLSDGALQVLATDTITATYNDASNGDDVPAVKLDTATLDCAPPSISNVGLVLAGSNFALLEFKTSEPCSGAVAYGASCGAATTIAGGEGSTEHSVLVTGLTPNTTYRYKARATDGGGNLVESDNGGTCYTFTTAPFFDFFTEAFEDEPDLAFTSLTFTPNASAAKYQLCTETVSALPTATSGSLNVILDDDDFQFYDVTGGQMVTLYGEEYSRFYINSNGNLTFEGGDVNYIPSLTAHFSEPRIALMFLDLDPTAGGSVLLKQTGDRVAVTYLNIREWGQNDATTMQVELFFDGVIRITYLGVQADFGITGLSNGLGVAALSTLSDLSGYIDCADFEPFVSPYIVGDIWAEEGRSATLEIVYSGLQGEPSFAWSRNFTPVGGNSPTLTVASVTVADEGYYRAAVSDASKAVYYTPSFFVEVLPANGLPAASMAGLTALVVSLAGLHLLRRRKS